MFIFPVGICHGLCVCTPKSRDSLEYISELLLKVIGGQANVENK